MARAVSSLVLVTLLLSSGLVVAQESPAYVTKIDAQASLGKVTLTWKDAEGWPGAKYEIWRSEKDLVKDSLPTAKLLGSVGTGVQTFDDTTNAGTAYYLVLLKDADGNRKAFYIPGRNKTATPIAALSLNPKATALITGVTVTLSGKSVNLQFKAFPTDRKLNIYRSSKPIKSLVDIKEATLLGQTTGAKASWVDTPAPGLEFYYTVLDAVAFAEGAADVFQAENTTEQAWGFPLIAPSTAQTDRVLEAKLRPTFDSAARPLPLPLLTLTSDPATGAAMAAPAPALAQPVPVSPATEKVLQAWAKGAPTQPKSLPAITVLLPETSKSATGTQKLLSQIVTSYVAQKDWNTAGEQLRLLLKLELADDLRARAHFYLGQVLAQQKLLRQALLEFLTARANSSVPADDFIDSLLSLLASS